MAENSSLIYGVDYECRSLCSQYNENLSITRYFIGTQSLIKNNGNNNNNDNQIHLLEYFDDNNSLNKYVFKHSVGEIWQLLSFTKQSKFLLTSYSYPTTANTTNSVKIENNFTLWEIPVDLSDDNLYDNDSNQSSSSLLPMENIHTFSNDGKFDENLSHTARIKPDDENELILCLETKLALVDLETFKLKQYIDINDKQTQQSNTSSTTSSRLTKISNCNWSPHFNSNIITIICNNNIYAKDLRISSSTANSNSYEMNSNHTWKIMKGHEQMIRDMDFNPNSQYYFATCGDDCEIKFWDIRCITKPVLNMLYHTHWVWSIRYNSFHDQLLLSSSSDGNVNLLKAESIASQSFEQLINDDDDSSCSDTGSNDDGVEKCNDSNENNAPTAKNSMKTEDGLIKKYEDHCDSVYSIEWSPNDPWIFASLSYDGRLIINKVPEYVKMDILH